MVAMMVERFVLMHITMCEKKNISKSGFHNSINVHLIIYHGNSLQNQSCIHLKRPYLCKFFIVEDTHYTHISHIPNNYDPLLPSQKTDKYWYWGEQNHLKGKLMLKGDITLIIIPLAFLLLEKKSTNAKFPGVDKGRICVWWVTIEQCHSCDLGLVLFLSRQLLFFILPLDMYFTPCHLPGCCWTSEEIWCPMTFAGLTYFIYYQDSQRLVSIDVQRVNHRGIAAS